MEKHEIERLMAQLQTNINTLSQGAAKAATQDTFNALAVMLEQSGACGPLRVGIELPAAE